MTEMAVTDDKKWLTDVVGLVLSTWLLYRPAGAVGERGSFPMVLRSRQLTLESRP